MARRRVIAACLLVTAALAVAARIWWVAENVPQIPIERYGQGEWVELDGAFQNNADEGTDDYSVMVEGISVMTYDEYLEAYGEGPQEPGAKGDSRCVVDVALRIRNDGTEPGGLNVFQMVLVPARANEYLICDVMNADALWPQVQEGASAIVSIRPGTEYVAHIPYVFNGGDEVYQREVTDTEFSLLVSRMPTRKMVVVSV